MKYVYILSSFLFLTACEPNNKPILFKDNAVSAPTPSPLSLEQIEWKVLNHQMLQTFILESNTVIYYLTPEDFSLMNKNLLEFRRYILEQKEVINFYKNLEQSTN